MQNSICDKISWRVEIPDDQLRTIGFAYRSATTYEGGPLVSMDLQVRPYLPAGETFKIESYGRKAYGPGAVRHTVPIDTTHTGRNSFNIYS